MNRQLPEYFYIAHINTKNALVFQKVLALANAYFPSRVDGCVVNHQSFASSNFTLTVNSPKPLARHLTGAFENLWEEDPDVRIVLSHSTSSFAGDKSLPVAPTYVYSTVLFLNDEDHSSAFIKWSRFKRSIYFIVWEFVNAKTFYENDQKEIHIYIESRNILNPSTLVKLKKLLVTESVKFQSFYQNF